MFFNRVFRKRYASLQKSSKGVLREFYEEAIYYLHQPSSINFRLVFCSGLIYWLSVMILNYQYYYASTYKRKKMRLLELRNQNLPPMSREEHDLLNKSARDNYDR